MNIVIFETQERDRVFFGEQYNEEHNLVFVEEPLRKENASTYGDAEIVCTFIQSKVSREVIDAMPQLKLITTRSTGFDHIDGTYAKEKNIPVCTVPQYGANTVAEHTFALILNLSRQVHKSYVRAMNNNYEHNDLIGFDLEGKTLGVVGAGHIGQHVIRIAKGFGMHVLAYDQYRNDFIAGLMHFKYVDDINELFAKSDIITLHVPAIPQTHHLVGEEQIAKMKKGALIINTSRGEVIDTESLYHALKSGQLGGAGLDVIEGEQYVKEDKALLVESDPEKMKILLETKDILQMDNVVFTPHNAFNSHEALRRILEVTRDNIKLFLEGKVTNKVN